LIEDLGVEKYFQHNQCHVYQCINCSTSTVVSESNLNRVVVSCPFELYLILTEGKISMNIQYDESKQKFISVPNTVIKHCSKCNSNQRFLQTIYYDFTNPYFVVSYKTTTGNLNRPKSFPISINLPTINYPHKSLPDTQKSIGAVDIDNNQKCQHSKSRKSCHLISQVNFKGRITRTNLNTDDGAITSGHYYAYCRRTAKHAHNHISEKIFKFDNENISMIPNIQFGENENTNFLIYYVQKDD
jgi:hypothetical protein